MIFELDRFEIVSKIFLGANLKIVFKNQFEDADRKVLELNGIVGFIENSTVKGQLKSLRIDDDNGGGSYPFDLSIRLKVKEIKSFPEAFIFVDTPCGEFCFRAVAKSIIFRDWNEKDKWLR